MRNSIKSGAETMKNPNRSTLRRGEFPLTSAEKGLIAANLRYSVDERLKRHDAALNDLLALRSAVTARSKNV